MYPFGYKSNFRNAFNQKLTSEAETIGFMIKQARSKALRECLLSVFDKTVGILMKMEFRS